jgi:hypothetical protein
MTTLDNFLINDKQSPLGGASFKEGETFIPNVIASSLAVKTVANSARAQRRQTAKCVFRKQRHRAIPIAFDSRQIYSSDDAIG